MSRRPRKPTLFPYTPPSRPAPADGADPVLAGAGPTPLTPTAATAEASAPAAPAGDDAPVAAQLGRQLAVLRSEEHTSELQSRQYLVCRLLLEKKKTINTTPH